MRSFAAIHRPRFRFLHYGRVGSWCPSEQGAGGDVLRDLSGRGNNGALTNMDPATDWPVSGDGVALDFDGVNDYVETAPISATGNNRTFCAWVYSNGNTSFHGIVVQSKDITSGLSKNYTGLQFKFGDANKAHIVVGDGTSFDNSGVTSIPIGEWVHLAGVITGSSDMRLYKNGSLVVNTALAINPFATPEKAYCARLATLYMNGQLDDMAIYNRALSPAEIQLLALRRGIAYEQTEFDPYTTQWGSVAVAAPTFSPYWGHPITTIAGPSGGL